MTVDPNEEIKTRLVKELLELWGSSAVQLGDSDRARTLRGEILKRALSIILTDDERARLFGLPSGCRMRENAKIISPGNLSCGKHVWIGEGAVIDASGGLEIGDHTSIGLGVFVWSHTSPMTNLLMQNHSGSRYIERKKTKIGDGCFIGGPSVIYPGVTIGTKVVVLPMSVITKDVPSYSVIGGSPAKIIRSIDENWIASEKARIDAMLD